MSEKLVAGASSLLARRSSRRGFLGRAALVGSALSVAPVRYLLRPEPAMAVLKPSDCGNKLCSDGYTEFCCSLRKGKNACPHNSFVGGWWKCTRYKGGNLCAKEGERYYIDCNRAPGEGCKCKCGEGRCDHRRACCNVFRYGQCNTQIGGTSEVVCRVVTCEKPWKVKEFKCGKSAARDNNTCSHEAACKCGECAKHEDRRYQRR